jgi:hypothetical protein
MTFTNEKKKILRQELWSVHNKKSVDQLISCVLKSTRKWLQVLTDWNF